MGTQRERRPRLATTPAVLAAELAAHCETLAPYPQDRFSGEGIVICAGGASIFTNAYVLIYVLRHTFRCALPIEVWHLGSDEMSARMRIILRELAAKTVDADAVMAAHGVVLHDGWQLKSFALSHSSFSRVLLLDADIVPERDPADLFRWPEFEATGAVLWPDICSVVAENPIWSACGLAPRTTRAVESGQVLIDKGRHWQTLQIIVFLNRQGEHYYRMVYGDKDLFLVGFIVAGRPYHLVPHAPFVDQGCLFQRDFRGERLFQHRTLAKWRYRDPQIEVVGFRHRDACEEALEALRRSWRGHVFNAPAREPAALAEEARLSAVRTIRLATPGEVPTTFDLAEGGDILNGEMSGLVHWYCTGGDAIELVLRDLFGRCTRFASAGDGCWAEAGSAVASGSVLVETPGLRHEMRVTTPDKTYGWDRTRYRFDDDT